MPGLLLFLFVFTSCVQQDEESQAELPGKPVVVSVNYPLHYFVKETAGGHVRPVFDVPAGVDPAYWKPGENEILAVQNADLIIINGADYAGWLAKISLPASRVVNTSKAFRDQYIKSGKTITHSHGPEGEHEHPGYASNTWLNFQYALQQAEAVREALTDLVPQAASEFEHNSSSLKSRLEDLDSEMREIAGSLSGVTLYGSHPVYQYLASGYDLTILNEHWEPDEAVSAEQWQAFIRSHNKYNGIAMLWESEPLPETRQKLEQSGIAVVVFNIAANRPESGDFISCMQSNFNRLRQIVNR
jgi:zinc transport system substrate-binding protein